MIDSQNSADLGTIANYFESGELVVKTVSAEVLLPFVKAFVPKVDVEAGLIEITPPGGLFEEIEEADAN